MGTEPGPKLIPTLKQISIGGQLVLDLVFQFTFIHINIFINKKTQITVWLGMMKWLFFHRHF